MKDPCKVRQVKVAISDLEVFLDRIRGIGVRHRVHIIFLNAKKMAGLAHVQAALSHAFRAEQQGSMISSRVEMEALLYAAGSRQILNGTEFGLHHGENEAYLCLCPEREEAWEELSSLVTGADSEDWEETDPEKFALLSTLFSITPEELAVTGHDRLRDLVLERVALLEVYR